MYLLDYYNHLDWKGLLIIELVMLVQIKWTTWCITETQGLILMKLNGSPKKITLKLDLGTYPTVCLF